MQPVFLLLMSVIHIQFVIPRAVEAVKRHIWRVLRRLRNSPEGFRQGPGVVWCVSAAQSNIRDLEFGTTAAEFDNIPSGTEDTVQIDWKDIFT